MTTEEMRELDVWIAEHVMGWKKVSRATDLLEGEYCLSRNMARIPFVFTGERPSGEKRFMPTEDPAAAMEVLKKCCEGKRCVAVSQDKAGNFDITSIDKDCQGIFVATAYTLELAICLFAKKLFAA